MTQDEAYIQARDEFWREQIRNPPYNWAKWRKIFWWALAAAPLVGLAAAGAPWILIFIPAALILAATWKIWVGLLLVGLL